MTTHPLGQIEPETRETEMRTFKVRAYHPVCGGELVSTGHGITQLRTNWLHRCNKCGTEAWFEERYPEIVHRENDN